MIGDEEVMNFYSVLIKSGKILEGYFEQSKNILHNGSKGTVRENIINKVIRPFCLLDMVCLVAKHLIGDALYRPRFLIRNIL